MKNCLEKCMMDQQFYRGAGVQKVVVHRQRILHKAETVMINCGKTVGRHVLVNEKYI
jgi:hypothetical protein